MLRAELAVSDHPGLRAAPLRVLHLSAGNLYGGIETFLVTLARHRGLCADIEPAYALCFEGRLAEELRQAGAPVTILGAARMSRPWTLWRVRRRLAELLRRECWDIVATHGCWPHALAAPVVRRDGVGRRVDGARVALGGAASVEDREARSDEPHEPQGTPPRQSGPYSFANRRTLSTV